MKNCYLCYRPVSEETDCELKWPEPASANGGTFMVLQWVHLECLNQAVGLINRTVCRFCGRGHTQQVSRAAG